MNVSAADWQAIFEGIVAFQLVWSALYGVLMYRMGGTFVTRKELERVTGGIAENGDAIRKVNEKMGGLVSTGQVAGIYDRLAAVERQGASVSAQVEGVAKQLHGANNMLQMLVKNEIDGPRRS